MALARKKEVRLREDIFALKSKAHFEQQPANDRWNSLYLPITVISSVFSILVLLTLPYAINSWWFLSIICASLIGAVYAPQFFLAAFLSGLPVLGNKPGTEQSYLLLVFSSIMVFAVQCNLLMSRGRAGDRGSTPLVLKYVWHYAVVSILSLSALPILYFAQEVLARFSGFSLSALSITFLDFLRVRATSIAYSPLSVLFTLQAVSLGYLSYRLWGDNTKKLLFFSSAILCGLVLTLTVGLLDYYKLTSLLWLRSLDPIVNPNGVQFRMQSFFGHSGWAAEYITLCIPFALLVLAAKLPYFVRLALLLAIVVMGEYCLIVSYQRGGWVSYPLTLLAIWFAIYIVRKIEVHANSKALFIDGAVHIGKLARASVLKVAVSLPLTVLASFFLLSLVMQEDLLTSGQHPYLHQYVKRFKAITRTSDRTEFAVAGLRLAALHPFLGAGSESFGWQYEVEIAALDGRLHGAANLPLHGSAHNVFIQTLCGKGLLGLLFLLLIAGSTILRGCKGVLKGENYRLEERLLLLVAVCFFCAFLIYGNFQEVFYVHSLQVLFFMVSGLFAALVFRDDPEAGCAIGAGGGTGRRFRQSLPMLLAVSFAAHLLWEYGYPANALTLANKYRHYGCYGVETNAGGESYRWCSHRALQQFKAELRSSPKKQYIIPIEFETVHLGAGKRFDYLSVFLEDRELARVRVEALMRYKVDIVLPKDLHNELYADNSIDLKLLTASSFIPVRDLSASGDNRVLSYKLYTKSAD